MIIMKTGTFELRSWGTERYYLLKNLAADLDVLLIGDDATDFEGLLATELAANPAMMTDEAIGIIWRNRLGQRAQSCGGQP